MILTEHRSAFIFPAFETQYPDDLFKGIPNLESRFKELLADSVNHIDKDLTGLSLEPGQFPSGELDLQFITYIYSCAISDLLNEKEPSAFITAGYSMGIYAALYFSGAISFGDGLKLIRFAFNIVKELSNGKKFSMSSVIGLDKDDILELIRDNSLQIEISNRISEYAFVVSGVYKDIISFNEKAKSEGALHASMLNVSFPYHSHFLNGTNSLFKDSIKSISFSKAVPGIISLIDQKIMKEPKDLRAEVIRNLSSPLNWYETQLELQRSGANLFIECGMGNSLTKNAKFIEGDFLFLTATDYCNNLL